MTDHKVLLSKFIDKGFSGKITIQDINGLYELNKGALKYFSAKLWMLMAVVESGVINVDNVSTKVKTEKLQFDQQVKKGLFDALRKLNVPPHYPKGITAFKNEGHTLRELIVRRATKSLALALHSHTPPNEDLVRALKVTASFLLPSDDDCIKIFNSLLSAGADMSFRNNDVMRNLNSTLGGQSILVNMDIEESNILSKIDKDNYPFFRMLAKHDSVQYVYPLMLKYHLLVTDKTPLDYMVIAKPSEYDAAATLLRA